MFHTRFTITRRVLLALFLFLAVSSPAAPASSTTGVPIAYELPTDGPLPRTYLVTLAIVEAKNPDWIISEFAAGS